MSKLCGVYLLTHIETGRKYVGQSVDIHKRWRCHSRTTEDSYIGHAIRKYGIAAFEKSVLELCDISELNDKESEYMQRLSTIAPHGFNLRNGGGQIGSHHRDTKLKMSISRKGKPKGSDHKAKIGDAHRGRAQSPDFVARRKAMNRKMPEESKARISRLNTGRTVSEETRAKLSASSQRCGISQETRRKMADANRGKKRSGAALEAITEANRRRTPEQKTEATTKRLATFAKNKLLRQNATIPTAGGLSSDLI